mmetsp:Transcript_7221/g.20354  ORF Transcript_7221/g.20354 Transcript_7221/m.20354 type:complete len:212 (-) Transcript_7221:1883-2518(-)
MICLPLRNLQSPQNQEQTGMLDLNRTQARLWRPRCPSVAPAAESLPSSLLLPRSRKPKWLPAEEGERREAALEEVNLLARLLESAVEGVLVGEGAADLQDWQLQRQQQPPRQWRLRRCTKLRRLQQMLTLRRNRMQRRILVRRTIPERWMTPRRGSLTSQQKPERSGAQRSTSASSRRWRSMAGNGSLWQNMYTLAHPCKFGVMLRSITTS